jgi:hypothetical protein
MAATEPNRKSAGFRLFCFTVQQFIDIRAQQRRTRRGFAACGPPMAITRSAHSSPE